MPVRVSIVILNYNGKRWLEEFLPGVLRFSAFDWAEVVVTDNASTDDSVVWMKQNHPDVRLIESDKNYGYAGGYNHCLKQIDAEYFILLNSDVELTDHSLPPLLRYMDEHQDTAACQPVLRAWHQRDHFEYAGAAGGFMDYMGYPFCRGRIFDTVEEDKGQYESDIECDWASGACLMIRRDAFYEAGELDEDFFAHMEEIDLCWRLKRLGYKIACAGKAEVYHVGGGTLPQGNPRKTYLNFRNNLCMLLKNLPASHIPGVLLLRLILDGIAGAMLLLKFQPSGTWAIVRAHFDFYGMIPLMWSKRKAFEQKHSKHKAVKLFSSSVLLAYYLMGKKKFSELRIS